MRIFSTLRKEPRGLMPGVLGSVAALAAAAILDDVVEFAEVDEAEESVETGGMPLGLGLGEGSGVAMVDALRRYSAILSLYASFRDSTDWWPSLQSSKIDWSALIPSHGSKAIAYCFAFWSSLCLYLSSTCCGSRWVARKRTSCTWAHLLCWG